MVDLVLFVTVLTVGLALVFDFTNGFHDAANATATVIASKCLSPIAAVILAGTFNFLPALIGATAVANSVSKIVKIDTLPDVGIIPTGISVTLSGLIASIFWNFLTWKLGIPSSSSHAIIGGIIGAGIAASHTSDVINWIILRNVAIAIAVSPILSFILSIIAMLFIRLILYFSNKKICNTGYTFPTIDQDSTIFRILQIISSAWVSWAHGANDAQKTMGIIVATLYSGGYIKGANSDSLIPPLWVILSANAMITLGTIFGGWSIIETMGISITKITRASGFAANLGAITSVESATFIGVPISTTQAAASSILGSGVGGNQPVCWYVMRNMIVAWLITLPVSAIIGFNIFQITYLPQPYYLISLITIVSVLLLYAIYSFITSKTSHDISKKIDNNSKASNSENNLENNSENDIEMQILPIRNSNDRNSLENRINKNTDQIQNNESKEFLINEAAPGTEDNKYHNNFVYSFINKINPYNKVDINQ